jgi:dephospho-CoA kinase
MQAKKLGNFSGNDIELCRTTNCIVSDRTAELLVEERIPFTRNCLKIPFFRRDKYDGASRVYVISINPHSYGQARRAIDTMDISQRKRLVLSNY